MFNSYYRLVDKETQYERLDKWIWKSPFKQRTEKMRWWKDFHEPVGKAVWGDEYDVIIEQQLAIQERIYPFLSLFGDLPAATVRLVKGDDWEHTCAKAGGGYIYIKKTYFDNADKADLDRVLKHELVHLFMQWNEIEEEDSHGPIFQEKLKSVLLPEEGGYDWPDQGMAVKRPFLPPPPVPKENEDPLGLFE